MNAQSQSAAKVKLELVRNIHDELSLSAVTFFDTTSPTSERLFVDKRTERPLATGRFEWKKQRAMRAMTVLLLRYFASIHENGPLASGGKPFLLVGGNGSLAASLYEVITNSSRNFWFKKLWLSKKEAYEELALKKCIFDGTGDPKARHYTAWLGATLVEAKMDATLDGKPVHAKDYAALADELDPLYGELSIETRKNGVGQWQSANEEDLPINPNDHLRITARLNRPAHICIVWLGSSGRHTVIHPLDLENPGAWPEVWPPEMAGEINLPDFYPDAGHWYAEGLPGAETFILVAVAKEVRPDLVRKCFEGLPTPIPYRSEKELIPMRLVPRNTLAKSPQRPRSQSRDWGILVRPKHALDLLAESLSSNLSRCCLFACGVSVPSQGGVK